MKKVINWRSYFGIVTVIILWSSILTAKYKADLSFFGQKPLSHLGVASISAPYFSLGLIIAAVTLVIFGFYIKQKYKVSRGFIIALLIGQLGQVTAAIAPYGDKQPARAIHTIAAFTLAFSIPIFMWYFARSQRASPFRINTYRLLWLELVAFVVGIGLFATNGMPIGQILPAFAFHIWIFYVSFKSVS